ncbi:hypothetical protein FBX97_2567 [Herbaspirillum sp. SJZ107]|nr:hypothetical protein FBX97_2567 [Herbaspirillum sp. SJZ107]
MPRPVNFCPWCGTAQGQAAARAGTGTGAEADVHARRPDVAAAVAANAGAAAAAAMSGGLDMPLSDVPVPPPPPPPEPPAPPAQPNPATPRKGVTANVRGPGVPPSATDFGRSASAGGSNAPGAAPPHQEVPRPPIPARPPQRRPVQLRWWILALAILAGVWLLARPSPKKIERQIDHAVALAKECKSNEAQAELISLGRSRATPAQLEQLQKTLNEQSAICTRRRLRNKAWLEASTAADAALDAGSAEKARARLQGFIRRWGEDGKTRELKARIDEAAAREKHPLAVPPEQGEVGVGRRADGV